MFNTFHRREFLATAAATIGTARYGSGRLTSESSSTIEQSFPQPAFSITPVVADGKWIWRDPPGERGYLEPREFEMSVGIQFTGTGNATELQATTFALAGYREQEILDLRIESSGCEARVVPITESAAQFALSARSLGAGQTARATATYRLKISKSFLGFSKDQFPADQPQKKQVPGMYLKSSPGIRITSSLVKSTAMKSAGSVPHPWDQASRFYDWVWNQISGVPCRYTSVDEAIRNRQGDCEERACTFIALCRSMGIPARQVWVPNHVWAEIALHDHDGSWHWIPVHTAAYNWFGWTGAHEVVLQKGDRIQIPSRNRNLRLIDDWYRIKGPRPKTRFTAEIKPIAGPDQPDAGPGGRTKNSDGTWKLTGEHSGNRHLRDR